MRRLTDRRWRTAVPVAIGLALCVMVASWSRGTQRSLHLSNAESGAGQSAAPPSVPLDASPSTAARLHPTFLPAGFRDAGETLQPLGAMGGDGDNSRVAASEKKVRSLSYDDGSGIKGRPGSDERRAPPRRAIVINIADTSMAPAAMEGLLKTVPGAEKIDVRGHDALVAPGPSDGFVVQWFERDGLLVVVAGTGITKADVVRVAKGLTEK